LETLRAYGPLSTREVTDLVIEFIDPRNAVRWYETARSGSKGGSGAALSTMILIGARDCVAHAIVHLRKRGLVQLVSGTPKTKEGGRAIYDIADRSTHARGIDAQAALEAKQKLGAEAFSRFATAAQQRRLEL